jgi:hypothetical protein
MTAPAQAPFFEGSFPHTWQAEILPARPLILPARHFVYPRDAEEVERGALEVHIRPSPVHLDEERSAALKAEELKRAAALKGHDFIRAEKAEKMSRALAPEGHFSELKSGIDASSIPQEFLATCALGFRDPLVPTGLWSAPNPDEICAVSGGYAYMIDTTAPERFTMIAYRPVLQILPVPAENLLLFVGHHSILAWGATGRAWQSEKLSDEGVTLADLNMEESDGPILHGLGWNLMTDKETPFALDLKTGLLKS